MRTEFLVAVVLALAGAAGCGGPQDENVARTQAALGSTWPTAFPIGDLQGLKTMDMAGNYYLSGDIDGLNATWVPKHTLLQQADFVSLHVPLSLATTHFIGVEELRMMRPTAYLINAARGPVMDEVALIQALQQGWIAGAALDSLMPSPTKGGKAVEDVQLPGDDAK